MFSKLFDLYKALLKPILFLFPPETAHHITFRLLKISMMIPGIPSLIKAIYNYQNPELKTEIGGLQIQNRVGLAAGLDKNAQYLKVLSNLGFGFIEIGTVTPLPQSGNPKPRLFRLKKDQALINRMGFNNEGVDAVVKRLKKRPKGIIIGGNIGKNKITPNEEAVHDYIICFNKLFDWVDYFTVNVSSPNTPDLRELQEKEPLMELLNTLQSINQNKPVQKPIFLKIAPDLNHSQLDDIIEIVDKTGITGIIATNTTISRTSLLSDDRKLETIGHGGLSGKPLGNPSTEIIRYLKDRLDENVLIIGVGGIHSARDAMEKMEAGASVVQIYTGLIYEGPGLIRQINKSLVNQ